MLETGIAVCILLAVVGTAVWYVHRAKKRGVKCVGCPHGGKCGGDCGCCGKSK